MNARRLSAFALGLFGVFVALTLGRSLAPIFGANSGLWLPLLGVSTGAFAVGYALDRESVDEPSAALEKRLWYAGTAAALFPFLRAPLLKLLLPLGLSLSAWPACLLLGGGFFISLGMLARRITPRPTAEQNEQRRGTLSLALIGALLGAGLGLFLLLPNIPTLTLMGASGASLIALGGLLSRRAKREVPIVFLLLAATGLFGLGHRPRQVLPSAEGGAEPIRVLSRLPSASGLIQVLDVPGTGRLLQVDGTQLGAIDPHSGQSQLPREAYLPFVAHRYHPTAKRTLVLGLGTGSVSETLKSLGQEVTAVESEPKLVAAARTLLRLSSDLKVHIAEPFAFLESERATYDLIVLDAFSTLAAPPSALLRVETLRLLRARLKPGGRVVIGYVTQADGDTKGQKALEAGLCEVFGGALVFLEPRLPTEGKELVASTLVAGADLKAHDIPYPPKVSDAVAPYLGDLRATPPRAAREGNAHHRSLLDTLHDLDGSVRRTWRAKVVSELGPDILQD